MTLKFKTPAMEAFFKSGHTHPDIVSAAVEFSHWSASRRLPDPLVSDLQRSKDELTRIYYNHYLDLRHIARTGGLDLLSLDDQEVAKQCRGLTDEECLAKAKDRFSWHLVGAAIDFSVQPYDSSQLARIDDFFKRFTSPHWEFKMHVVVGARPHPHLGRRDFPWRTKVERVQRNS